MIGKRLRIIATNIIKIIIIVSIISLILLPLFYSINTSLKDKATYVLNPIGIDFHNVTFDNYINILNNFNFGQKLLNTSIVVVSSIISVILLAIPCAYIICNLKSKILRNLVLIICFSLMFIPEEVTLLPRYNLFSSLGLINSFVSIVFIFIADYLPELIVLLCAYISLIPKEIIVAAKLDGASDLRCIYSIIIPIIKSPILVIAITSAISMWNSFLTPMIFLYNEEVKMLMPALSGLITKHNTNPTYQMAGLVLSMLPLLIVYFVFKKQIFKATIDGAIK